MSLWPLFLSLLKNSGTPPYSIAVQRSRASDPAISGSPPHTVPAGFSLSLSLSRSLSLVACLYLSLSLTLARSLSVSLVLSLSLSFALSLSLALSLPLFLSLSLSLSQSGDVLSQSGDARVRMRVRVLMPVAHFIGRFFMVTRTCHTWFHRCSTVSHCGPLLLRLHLVVRGNDN